VSFGRNAPPWLIGAAGLAIGAVMALRILIPYGMDPTIFVSFGDGSSVQTAYVRRVLGHATSREAFAHDGKYFFTQANDPWFLEPERNAVVLDRPIYRAQRMLYPAIAGGFGLFPPEVVVWSMLVTNLAALAAGTWWAASLAALWGETPWLGLSVPLNIGLLFELEIGGAGILAYALCLGGLYALERNRIWGAAGLFAAAALSREVMLLFPVGLLVSWWLHDRRTIWPIVVTPLAALAVWHVYIRFRLSGISGVGGGVGAFAPPFVGMFHAFAWWTRYPHLLINLAIVAILVLFTPLALRSRSPMAWGALPFVALAVVFSEDVWRETFDLTRALTPIFTAIPFVVIANRRTQDRRLNRDLIRSRP
jgi:hypothetical protein